MSCKLKLYLYTTGSIDGITPQKLNDKEAIEVKTNNKLFILY